MNLNSSHKGNDRREVVRTWFNGTNTNLHMESDKSHHIKEYSSQLEADAGLQNCIHTHNDTIRSVGAIN